jgi:hypothetical protein
MSPYSQSSARTPAVVSTSGGRPFFLLVILLLAVVLRGILKRESIMCEEKNV